MSTLTKDGIIAAYRALAAANEPIYFKFDWKIFALNFSCSVERRKREAAYFVDMLDTGEDVNR